MLPTDAEIDAALEAVLTAARRHRAVLRAQTATDDEIWSAYVTLNNASVHYDDLINRAYDEVTPWDCEFIEEEDGGVPAAVETAPATPLPVAEQATPVDTSAGAAPTVIAVRHRRDYLVTDVPALLATAAAAQVREGNEAEPIVHLGQAVYVLIEAGDGTIAALDDIEELEPGNGLLLVNEVPQPIDLQDVDSDVDGAFRVSEQDRLLYRLDEVMVTEEGEAETVR